jgi:hypothetical protein
MCIISKQILLYGSDVQLYNEKAFQNSDDEDFEPSLNFTLRFVMLISYVSVETFVLITEPCMIICHRSFKKLFKIILNL